MQEKPTRRIAVLLARVSVDSPWETHRWDLVAAVPDMGGEPRTVMQDSSALQRMHPGYELTLHADEAEGYYLNASSGAPSVFVALRLDDATGDLYPYQATLSYNEAARWMDGSERVERCDAWPELAEWMGSWVEANYRPEPKKRRKPRSFEGKEGVFREEGGS